MPWRGDASHICLCGGRVGAKPVAGVSIMLLYRYCVQSDGRGEHARGMRAAGLIQQIAIAGLFWRRVGGRVFTCRLQQPQHPYNCQVVFLACRDRLLQHRLSRRTLLHFHPELIQAMEMSGSRVACRFASVLGPDKKRARCQLCR